MNFADRTASAMASSATGVVRKQGKAEGSPWPRGTVGLVSCGSILPMMFVRTVLMLVADAFVSASFPLNDHFFATVAVDEPFSISLLLSTGLIPSEAHTHTQREVKLLDKIHTHITTLLRYSVGVVTVRPLLVVVGLWEDPPRIFFWQ